MSSNWLNRIRQHAETPPEGAWHTIAEHLSSETTASNSFATKLAALEIAPPPATQKNIFDLLDAEENTPSFDQRVYHYQEEAPAEVWPKIVAGLDDEGARIISIADRSANRKNSYRVAAAAVIIALLSVTAWLLTGKENSAGKNPIALQPSITTNPINPQTAAAVPAAENKEKTADVVNNKVPKTQVIQTLNSAVPAYVQNTEPLVLAQNPALSKKDKLQTVTGETPEDLSLMNTPNSYISITGPDGQSLKVSSKFSNIIGFLTENNPATQENLDIIIKESARWRATFAEWRNKMTNNAVAPALSNFMDIIELSDLLEDKK